MQTQTLTIQDARKLVKEGWRAYIDLAIGKAWWETPAAEAIRSQIGDRARLVVAQQNLSRVAEPVRAQAPVTEGFMPVVTPVVPEVKPAPAPVTEPEAMVKLRAEARALFPSDPAQPSTSKHNKAQAQRRRAYLVAKGAPKVAPKEGQVSFGRKLVNGVWVKL
jgi:hypothetical protein